MAGLPWFPVYAEFPTGPHAIALGVALAESRAWSYAIQLWAWAVRNKPDGEFVGPSAVEMVEAAAGWKGRSGALVEAMLLPHIGLLDQTASGLYIHNWHLHCGAHIEKLKKDRKRKYRGRMATRLRNVRGMSADDPGKVPGQSARASPSPSQSPSQSMSRSLAYDGTGTETSPSDAAPPPAAAPNGKSLGLDAEAQALLRLLPAKAVDVALALHLPAAAVDSALEELRGRGLVRLGAGMVPLWEVV